MLDTFQPDLYQRLQAFELDDPTHEFGFTRHLMKSQGWTLTYAQRAITEYKKFAFLTVVANHQVVPSDQVDQVWHAHVLLTRSYWEEFCPKILEKPLHHHPARGGRAERAEFHDLYAQTIASYQQFFGCPPTDIWSPSDVRFGAELKMQRVSLSDHWVIPKRFPRLKFPKRSNIVTQSLILITITISMITIGYVPMAQGSPFKQVVHYVSENQFLIAICATVILGLILRYVIRSPSQLPQQPQLDIYQIAYLAGGTSRAVELAITKLVHQGYLRPNIPNRTFAIEKRLPPEATRLEKQVMGKIRGTPSLKNLRKFDKYETSFLKRSLEQEKLLMMGWKASMGESFYIYLASSFLGIILILGIRNLLNVPLSLLGILMVLNMKIGIVTLCCLVPSLRTHWCSKILADIQKNHNVYDVTQRFALFGHEALSGGALDDVKQIFLAEAKAEVIENSGGCGCGC
jgi:uncharacterized protein (TIGR04222 family)